jgi:nitrogen fixation protein NifB
MNPKNHPCFHEKARHRFARIHLPVAPRCNIQCNFCNRQFDCVNESRPGVTSAVLSPDQALCYLEEAVKKLPNISVVGIAGPGDPFANAEKSLQTLRLVKDRYPDMLLCIATNGLNLLPYLDELMNIGISHVSITLNAVDPAIGKRIYSWVRHNKRVLDPDAGSKLLLENQIAAIAALKAHDVQVKVNTIVLPGINDHHIGEIAQQSAALNVDILNCMPYYPNRGSNFEHLEEPSRLQMAEIRKTAGGFLPQMHHCTRCRSDAVGLLGASSDPALMAFMKACESLSKTADLSLSDPNDRPFIAVATMEGMLVNQHLGEAQRLSIYQKQNGCVSLVETRTTPEPGGGKDRWEALSIAIADCRALLVNGIGQTPREVLSGKGIRIYELEGLIEDAVQAVFEGTSLNRFAGRRKSSCGSGCHGGGHGCM